MAIKVNNKLNIVIKVDMANDEEGYVHSVPISTEVFETYWRVLSKTYSTIYSEDLTVIGGPRVAYLVLKEIAQGDSIWNDGKGGGVELGLIGEIMRLSTIVAPAAALGRQGDARGWASLPLATAVARNLIEPQSFAELRNTLVFFTAISAMQRRPHRLQTLSVISGLWAASPTSSNSTEFAASLPTLMKEETSNDLMQNEDQVAVASPMDVLITTEDTPETNTVSLPY